ncbi:MAG: tetratricopeptide repeat protein [Planctomycetes bacterium]|nr:tetratricopeptide repeat protein [Planctomycetota bacterium]
MAEAAHSEWIIDTADETFEQDVIERSKQTPVVLDFWATWCQPCLMLKPVLEQMAQEYQGRFVLAKAEQQSNDRALKDFNVEAFPTVFGVVNGEPVDYFMGLMRPEQLRGWIDRLLQLGEAATAQHLEEADPLAAEAEYRKMLEAAPDDDRLQIGLARVLLAQGKTEECRQILRTLEERGFLEPEAEKLKATLDLSAKEGADVEKLRQQAEANPNDYAQKVKLAEAIAAQSQYEEALDLCLEVVEEDRAGAGESARKLMVEIFQVLPADSSLKTTYQRRLSAALY